MWEMCKYLDTTVYPNKFGEFSKILLSQYSLYILPLKIIKYKSKLANNIVVWTSYFCFNYFCLILLTLGLQKWKSTINLFLHVCIYSSFKREQYSYRHVKKLTVWSIYWEIFKNAIYLFIFKRWRWLIWKKQSHSGGLEKQF